MSDMRIYARQTDNSLPAVTTEEIETMQEGGYEDTESTASTESIAENNTEEVMP